MNGSVNSFCNEVRNPMKKTIGLICTILLLTAGSSFASAKVSNVELTWQDGFTVARVDVQGAVRFSHQTEEAKDGRPYRVIVDILSATHNLGQKTFSNLPTCPVTKIRTSQYAVSPEKVVRLVFDMKQETVYRVESNDNSVSIYFPDKTGSAFAAWSSSKVVAQPKSEPEAPKMAHVSEGPSASSTPTAPSRKTASELNKSMNDDRMASLQADQPKPSTPTAKAAPTTDKPAAPSHATVTKPTINKPVVTAPVPKPEIDSKPGPLATTSTPKVDSKPAPAKSEPAPSRSVATTPEPNAPSHPTATVAATTPKTTPPPAVSKPAPKAASKPAPKAAPTTASAAKSDSKPTPATASAKPSDNAKPTSRFRRSPTRPTKIKGTLVAEFPKRLVIKYNGGHRRDPFATLIDETKQNNSPIERRVPNVEGLRLVGIIEAELGNSALFEDKDGYGYILKEGDKVQKGYVLRVREDKVFFQIFEYGWSRTVALNLDRD